MTRFTRIGACGAALAVALAACSGGSLTGPLGFSPAAVLAFLADRNGNAIDGGTAAFVTIVMTNPGVECAGLDGGSRPSAMQIFTLMVVDRDGGVRAGNSYALSPNPLNPQFGFGALMDLHADAGSTRAAAYATGAATIRAVRPDRIEGSFDIDGTDLRDGGSINLKGDFATSTICRTN